MNRSILTLLAGIALAISSAAGAPDVNENISLGGKLSLEATTDAVPAASWQWFKDGNAISGATGSALAIEKLALTDSGTYTATASNVFGQMTSNKFMLLVGYAPTAPIIKSAFSAVTANKQQTVVLGVSAVGDDMRFKWQKGNALITGANGPSYTIAKANPSDAGTYAVTVWNNYGSVTASAPLTVLK